MVTQHIPSKRGKKPRHVIVFGGGLAGMVTAYDLLCGGASVTLIERKPYLGGRAYSFIDRETNEHLDNGQHIFLGCCTNYISFLKDLGVSHKSHLQRRLRVIVYGPDGRMGILSSNPLLPAPLHLAWSFLQYPHISLRDKLRAIPALVRIWRTDRSRNPDLEMQTFYEWLCGHGQSEEAIEKFWNLIIRPTLNDDVKVVSADMGFMVFQNGLLCNRHGGDVGYSRVGLSELMGDAALERIRGMGGMAMLGRSVQRILVQENKVNGLELSDGTILSADAYVSALPFDELLSALPSELQESDFFSRAKKLEWSPIVDLHLWYDRPVLEFDFAAFVGTPVQWVFNKTAISEGTEPGQNICISLSGAWEHWPRTKDALKKTFTSEIARLLPKAREAKVERVVVVKTQKATFRCVPGSANYRLPAKTPITNLILAGEWTDVDWPSTMEGAVRSGRRAAVLAKDTQE